MYKVLSLSLPKYPQINYTFSFSKEKEQIFNAAYFSWLTSSRLKDAAEERPNYFINLQKGVLPESIGRLPKGHQATTLLELMTIRASHSKILRCYSLGTAIGFRIRQGVLTDIPVILVFVSRKVNKQWLTPIQYLPTILEVIKERHPWFLSFCSASYASI